MLTLLQRVCQGNRHGKVPLSVRHYLSALNSLLQFAQCYWGQNLANSICPLPAASLLDTTCQRSQMKTQRLEEKGTCYSYLHGPRKSPSSWHQQVGSGRGSNCQLLFAPPEPCSQSPHPSLEVPALSRQQPPTRNTSPSPGAPPLSSWGTSSSQTGLSSEVCCPREPPSKLLGSINLTSLHPLFPQVSGAFYRDDLCADCVLPFCFFLQRLFHQLLTINSFY